MSNETCANAQNKELKPAIQFSVKDQLKTQAVPSTMFDAHNKLLPSLEKAIKVCQCALHVQHINSMRQSSITDHFCT